jgi:hypothetical protein
MIGEVSWDPKKNICKTSVGFLEFNPLCSTVWSKGHGQSVAKWRSRNRRIYAGIGTWICIYVIITGRPLVITVLYSINMDK